ncbi:MAG: SGNH/GDSL hydrolase family protein [Nitrospirota bacterium]|nr:SGNH/GDSL hydrolase family protein [Nitrospirota bacterium]MDP2383477.1 SGNH/GDSL hydrolase family protein [Nitrospirota bacterium]
MHKPRILSEWAIGFLLITVSCMVALGLAEMVVRVFFPISDGLENVTLDGKPIKSFFEPGSVYRQIANEYDALTTITDKGHRVPGVEGNPDIVFIGDSFTYGFGLNDEETFALVYCRQQRRECVNLGIPGSGTLRQVEKLETFIEKWHWKPKEVKLFFFGMSGSFSAGNDFVDNYDRYVREHSSQANVEQSVQDRTPRGGAPLGFTERLINLQGAILEHSTIMRLVKYHWGPMLKSLFVVDPGNERMAVALVATRESLAKLDELSRRIGFDYSIYLLVPVQDVIRGTYGETLATLNSVAPKPVVATAQLFLDSPKDYYYAFDGHLNVKGSKRIAEFLILKDH